MRIWIVVLAIAGVLILACGGSTTAEPKSHSPDLLVTIEAAVQSAIRTMTPATIVPTSAPTSAPTSTPRPIQPTKDLPATITAVVRTMIEALPTETPFPTKVPTATPDATREPTPTVLQTPTLSPSQDLASTIGRIRPGVVRVETIYGTGSGVIVELGRRNRAAVILTNYHVIEEVFAIDRWRPPDFIGRIDVIVNDSRTHHATVLGVDIRRDLAVIEICCGSFTALNFGDAEKLATGTQVIAMGYPLNIPGPATTTQGIVSGVRYESDEDRWVVQSDVPINQGNSGGPILSLSGEVLGINTYKIGGFLVEGLGFAVSAQTLQEQLPRLKTGGDALDAVNVLTKWTFGPNNSDGKGDVKIDSLPWVLAWNLGEGGTNLEVNIRNVYGVFWQIVNTTAPGSGEVVVYETGRFLFDFQGTGNYTVTIRAK